MKIVITGASGFLGRNVLELFQKNLDPEVSIVALSSKEFNLLDLSQARQAIKGANVVLHLAANVGGIGHLRSQGVKAFYDNYNMGLNIIAASLENAVKRLILIGTPCSYADACPLPLVESMIEVGLPSGDTGYYGLAKLAVSMAARQICIPAGLDVVTAIPSNLFGPYDHFNETGSHVVAALITKALRTPNHSSFEVWGDGSASRDFVYVGDVVAALLDIVRYEGRFDGAMINLGAGKEIQISELAFTIAKCVGRGIFPRFNPSLPSGYQRRVMSIDLARTLLRYNPHTGIDVGISKTIDFLQGSLI